MPPKRNQASSPGPVNSSKKLNGGGAASTIFKSRLQLQVAKESLNKSTHQSQASISPVLSTKKKARGTKKTTIQVQPTPPPPTSSNSSRPRRSSACLAVPSRLVDSQSLDLGSTGEDDEDDKDDKDDEVNDKGDDDDEYHLRRLRGDSSTAFITMDNTFSMRPGKDDNNNKKYFDRWFITIPVPMPRGHSTAAALVPARTVQAGGTIPSTPARAPSNGSSCSSAAAFNVHGGFMFESAFKGGFLERAADALISIGGGPGMGHEGGYSRQWTSSEAAFELAKKVTTSNLGGGGDIAPPHHLDLDARANPAEDEEGRKKHAGKMGTTTFRGRNMNLFPARRKKGDSDYYYLYDLGPSDFNRLFEEEAAKRDDAAEKHMQQLQLLAVEEEKKKMLASKELPPATHHSLPTRKSDLYFMDISSKEFKEPANRAKTWPGRNLFTATKKVVEDLDPMKATKESHWNSSHSETFRGLVKRLTIGPRDP